MRIGKHNLKRPRPAGVEGTHPKAIDDNGVGVDHAKDLVHLRKMKPTALQRVSILELGKTLDDDRVLVLVRAVRCGGSEMCVWVNRLEIPRRRNEGNRIGRIVPRSVWRRHRIWNDEAPRERGTSNLGN